MSLKKLKLQKLALVAGDNLSVREIHRLREAGIFPDELGRIYAEAHNCENPLVTIANEMRVFRQLYGAMAACVIVVAMVIAIMNYLVANRMDTGSLFGEAAVSCIGATGLGVLVLSGLLRVYRLRGCSGDRLAEARNFARLAGRFMEAAVFLLPLDRIGLKAVASDLLTWQAAQEWLGQVTEHLYRDDRTKGTVKNQALQAAAMLESRSRDFGPKGLGLVTSDLESLRAHVRSKMPQTPLAVAADASSPATGRSGT